MLTVRRGIARVGWVLLFVWTASVAGIMLFDTDAPRRPGLPTEPPKSVTQIILILVGVPLGVFLLWRLSLWIGQGFWQHKATPMTAPAPKAFQLPRSFGPCGQWRFSVRFCSSHMALLDFGRNGRSAEITLQERSAVWLHTPRSAPLSGPSWPGFCPRPERAHRAADVQTAAEEIFNSPRNGGAAVRRFSLCRWSPGGGVPSLVAREAMSRLSSRARRRWAAALASASGQAVRPGGPDL